MSQVDGWHYPDDREPYTIVGCPRDDCDARAIADGINGPWEMTADSAYLLDERYVPPRADRKKTHGPFRAKKSDIFAKTNGRCYYCGLVLEFAISFCVDHIVPQIKGGESDIENVVPACRNCNSAKGTKTLEQFRFHRRMQGFQKQSGVWFTAEQVQFLNGLGINLEIPPHKFWFEVGAEFKDAADYIVNKNAEL